MQQMKHEYNNYGDHTSSNRKANKNNNSSFQKFLHKLSFYILLELELGSQ